MFSNLVAFVPMLGAVAVFCAYLMLCGGLIAWALRARGFAFFTVAIPAGFAAIAVAQVGTHFIKLPWSPLLPLGVSIVTALLLGVAASFFAKKAPKPEKQTLQKWLQGIIAVIVLAAIYAITFVRALKEPTVISQTFDGNFHLNLADVFAARGSVDPFSVDLSSPGSNKFYPSLWHACVVLIMQMSGLTVDVATNALTIVAASLVWSTGMIALVRLLLGNKKIVQVAAVLGCIA
ncbi:MAG: hypothetical protein Q4C71_02810, partial [Microbacteriaceae bacterium]|nr:hypothetical protein [Microbacteriaceae bacterium]